MRFFTTIFTVAVLAGVLAPTLRAQETGDKKQATQPPAKSDAPAKNDAKASDAASSEKAAAPAAATPAVAEFDKQFAQWKELLAELRRLQQKYVNTPRKGGLREGLREEYEKRLKEGEQLEPKMIEVAEKALPDAGEARPEIGKFLLEQLKYYVEHDNDEPAVAIARTLIDNGYDNPRVYNYGGIAAYSANDFDLAAKWLKEGDKESVLEVSAKQFLSHIKQYQEMWKTERELQEAEAKADDLPRVVLKTTKGDIVVELFENEAPNTVANFISLVEKEFYDGIKFHRVLPNFMAQGGDPNGDGSGGPGYTIPDEIDRSDFRNHFRGSLSMAKTALPDSGGSQFFLMFRPSGPAAGNNLNGKHTVFGRVIDGLDVLWRIQRIDPEKPEPGVKADRILEAKVLRKRDHAYVPKKAGEEPASDESGDKKSGE